MPLAWSWCRFEDLGVDGVYDVLALRARCSSWSRGRTWIPTAPIGTPGTCSAVTPVGR